MTVRDPWLRLVLALYPTDFRQRMADDLLDTFDDLLEATPEAQRPRQRRRLLGQLAWAGIVERIASWFRPDPFPTRHTRSSSMDDLTHDLRSALRSLARRPGFALMVIVTLGIGLGASTAMYGVVDGVLIEPLPYIESERLVTLYRLDTRRGRETRNMSAPDLRDIQTELESLESAVGVGRWGGVLNRDGEPEVLDLGEASNGVLEVFRVAPLLGRDLTVADSEPEAPAVIVLTHQTWQGRFGGDPQVLGSVLEISDEPHTVVGIGPEGFAFPEGVEGWTGWRIDTSGCGRDCHVMPSLGRLADGSNLTRLGEELEALSLGLQETYPESNRYKMLGARALLDQEVAPVRSSLWLLLAAVQLVVLIAAANVANLVLVRGARRRRELAIRSAVGADRWRLFRQLMLENGLLALGGALVGLVTGQLALRLFVGLAPADLPRLDAIGLDGSVFGFTLLLSAVVLLIFGLVPAFRLATPELRSRGASEGPEGRRSRLGLLTAEVALALMLLLGAGLLLRSFSAISQIDLGFDPDHVARFSLVLPDASYPESSQIVDFTDRLEESLEGIPGVEVAGVALAGPFGHNRITSSITPRDRPLPEVGEALRASFDVVSPGYFEALRIPTLRGRVFDASDHQEATPALVISRSLAERYFPDKDPIGEQATIGVSFDGGEEDPVYTIVGVVEDVRAYSLIDEPIPAVYMAQGQTGMPYLTVFARTGAGVDVLPAARERVRALAPALPLRNIDTQRQAVDEALGPQRFYLALLTSFAGLALVLSAIGLYSVIAYLVARRSRELAVRMALGADANRILSLVLGDALKPAVLGIGIGLAGAFFASRMLESLLYGVSTHDTLTYVLAPAVLLAVALLASMTPALRATRLDPKVTLDEEA